MLVNKTKYMKIICMIFVSKYYFSKDDNIQSNQQIGNHN